MAGIHKFLAFPSRDAASKAVADAMLMQIRSAISNTGEASLLLSGGSTPRDTMKHLSAAQFECWADVSIGLVDERWVGTQSPDSNENLARTFLLHGAASSAKFVSMRGDAGAIDNAVLEAAAAYSGALLSPTIVMLGMGSDGHTASWFPGAPSLADAVCMDAVPDVIAVDVAGCPVAGDYPERLTVNLPVIAQAQHAALLMFGAEKRQVFETALGAPAEQYPIRYAVEALGDRLIIYWAE